MTFQFSKRPRGLETAECSLCGITLRKGLMVPDGGAACADLRWYCRDVQSCTRRWTRREPELARRHYSSGAIPADVAPARHDPESAYPDQTVPAASES